MKSLFLSSLYIALSCVMAFAGTQPTDFPLQKQLEPPEIIKRDVASAELDEEVLSQTEDNYSNVRVFDSNNVETPFLVRSKRRKKSVVREYSVSMNSVSLKELPENRIEIVLSQKEGKLASPGVVVFATRLKNFEKQVSVYGSKDQTKWVSIIENKPIFDYSRFFDITNKRVEISNAKYKYYKLVIANISQKQDSPIVNIVKDTRKDGLFSEIEKTSFMRKDFKIDKITFLAKKSFEVKTSQIKRDYTVRDLETKNQSDGKETIVTLSLDNVPLTKLTLLTDDSNFSRSVRLEGCDNPSSSMSWKPVARTTLTKIRMGKFNQNSTSINIGNAVRYKYYRITITNHDSPPLTIKSVKAEGEVHEAVFFCKDSMTYRMLYGGAILTLPKYDISDVLRRTDGEDTDSYSLGEEEKNPDSTDGGSTFSINSKSLLVIVIVIMIAALLWVITKTTKNIEELSQPQE
jgi:hypothetical protein